MGGSRHYILPGEAEELVVIEPKSNTLALVYRDEVVDEDGPAGIMHFTKFVNHRATGPMFQFNLVYRIKEPAEVVNDKWEKI